MEILVNSLPAEQRALVATAPQDVLSMVCSIMQQTSTSAIVASEFDDAAPARVKQGAQMNAIMIEQREYTGGTEPVLHLKVIANGPLREALYGLEKNADGETSVAYVGDDVAYMRCDAAYTLTQEDKNQINKKRKKPLAANRLKGQVPTGVVPICTGQIISVSVYKHTLLKLNGTDVPPGTELCIVGLTASHEYQPGMLAETVSVGFRASAVRIACADDKCGTRHSEALAAASFTPPILAKHTALRLPAWPTGMLVSFDELPVVQPAADSLPPSSEGASGALITGADALASAPNVIKLAETSTPFIYLRTRGVYVLHIRDNIAEAAARASVMVQGCGSVFTHTSGTVPSGGKEAFVYKKDTNDKSPEFVHAKFGLIVAQNTPSGVERFVIYTEIAAGAQIQLLTGTCMLEVQKMVAQALTYGLKGQICIDPQPAASTKCTLGGLEDALVYTAYASALPVSTLRETVQVAGFRVSADFVQLDRAMVSPDACESMTATPSTYYSVAGPASEDSELLVLPTTVFGYYDSASSKLIKGIHAQHRGMTERRNALRAIMPQLTGGPKLLGDRYAYFVVGRYCVTDTVFDHQRQLADSDLGALTEGNERMISTGSVPESWPVDDYQEMMNAVPVPAGYRNVIYAVRKDCLNSRVSTQRIKNQLEQAAERGSDAPRIKRESEESWPAGKRQDTTAEID